MYLLASSLPVEIGVQLWVDDCCELSISLGATMRLSNVFVSLAISLTIATHLQAQSGTSEDKLSWLEDFTSEKVKDWIKSENIRTSDRYAVGASYQNLYNETFNVLKMSARTDNTQHIGSNLYEVYKPEGAKVGVWRRSPWINYINGLPEWETVLDFDAMNKKDKTDFSLESISCVGASPDHCLISFLKYGSFSTVTKEFDLGSKSFVSDGFFLPLARSSLNWIDKDNVLLLDGIATGNQNESGGPRTIKLWKRNTKIEAATIVFETEVSDRRLTGQSYSSQPESNVVLLNLVHKDQSVEQKIFFANKMFDFKLPSHVGLIGFYNNQAIVFVKEKSDGAKKGAIFAYPITAENGLGIKPKVLWEPKAEDLVFDKLLIKNNLYISFVKDVKTHIARFDLANNARESRIDFPKDGALFMKKAGENSEVLKVTFENSLTPSTYYFYDPASAGISKVNFLPETFDSSEMEIKQSFLKTKDGSQIVYLLVGKKGMPLNSSNPTILFGYGGFNQIMLPIYMKLSGKVWLEKGGLFVFAHVRGDGEFGENGHKAGMGKLKQNVFDDIVMVAKDLIAKKITSPRHLGLNGASNGGLTAAAVYNQHPELFNAVVVEAVLDMARFDALGGRSWKGEYGDPSNPADLKYLKNYSPLHNVKKNTSAPEILFVTSSDDKVVNPAHSRKMAERLKQIGNPYLFYESDTGEHGLGTLDFMAKSKSIVSSFFWDKLGPAVVK
ncbi:MAG: S9 family peptidase [Proteobacteria bacterium]|nr:MAG: S9 family peptidase [Pseudomonadota bacterium]